MEEIDGSFRDGVVVTQAVRAALKSASGCIRLTGIEGRDEFAFESEFEHGRKVRLIPPLEGDDALSFSAVVLVFDDPNHSKA